ncbi:hypothetical protein [Streptomyces sp. AV19]|uniref:hypothetical protein n=1 Tax=Streptomyces sp. AV19 TaxID=2793068 RepID=UPI0024138954|nr:hypothetical protein [Streptomyces sp. AV19]MDG4531633.1 hypothetical protein [Streptomyces sp. AV19]
MTLLAWIWPVQTMLAALGLVTTCSPDGLNRYVLRALVALAVATVIVLVTL